MSVEPFTRCFVGIYFLLVCLVAGIMVLRRQALAEESSLEAVHGSDYQQYRERVPRWL